MRWGAEEGRDTIDTVATGEQGKHDEKLKWHHRHHVGMKTTRCVPINVLIVSWDLHTGKFFFPLGFSIPPPVCVWLSEIGIGLRDSQLF